MICFVFMLARKGKKMKGKSLAGGALLVFVAALVYWQYGFSSQSAEVSTAVQAPVSAAQQVEPTQTVEDLLTKFQQVTKEQNVPVGGSPQPATTLAQTPELSPEDEPVAAATDEVVVNIGPLIHPELDDPNLGQPPSEPIEIGELIDPETYIPPAPADEKEINIGPLLPPPGDDEPANETTEPEQIIEIGKPIDAAAEPEVDL